MSFDSQFRVPSIKGVPVETRPAEWHEYLPGMAKMLGFFVAGLVLDAVMEGLTGTKTNFATTAHLAGTGWYIFGPGAPEDKPVESGPEQRKPAPRLTP